MAMLPLPCYLTSEKKHGGAGPALRMAVARVNRPLDT